jgi:hypothetical protein
VNLSADEKVEEGQMDKSLQLTTDFQQGTNRGSKLIPFICKNEPNHSFFLVVTES